MSSESISTKMFAHFVHESFYYFYAEPKSFIRFLKYEVQA